ncbi:MAG: DUF481 domain-containing protein [Sneathiellales bacterium]|nr:DUF481 domain-containing protein [Sneathiellales bacterium]
MRKLLFSAACLSALQISAPVAAEEESYPKLSGELAIEVQDDWTFSSDDEEAELNDLYPTLTLATKLAFNEAFSLNLEATLEPVEDATDDRAFEDLGGFINILTANYDNEHFSVYVGKFTPNFGLAWDATPGLYSDDINGDLELAEMLGFGGEIPFTLAGEHAVSGSIFFADTTFLSDSAGKSRGPLDEDDGGPANTESLSSFALALNGAFEALPGFDYHLGFSALEEGDDGDEAQLGYVAAVQYSHEISDGVTLTPLVEYAYLDNAGGVDGDSARYLTGALGLEFGKWAAAATYQRRDTESGGADTDDYVAAFTLGYSFDFGLGLSAGYRFSEEDNVDNRGLGVMAEYVIEF